MDEDLKKFIEEMGYDDKDRLTEEQWKEVKKEHDEYVEQGFKEGEKIAELLVSTNIGEVAFALYRSAIILKKEEKGTITIIHYGSPMFSGCDKVNEQTVKNKSIITKITIRGHRDEPTVERNGELLVPVLYTKPKEEKFVLMGVLDEITNGLVKYYVIKESDEQEFYKVAEEYHENETIPKGYDLNEFEIRLKEKKILIIPSEVKHTYI